MATANPKVMEMCQAELAKNPDISNDELLKKAIKIDKTIEKLSPRQWNARYPLQVKRAMTDDGDGTKKQRKSGGRPKGSKNKKKHVEQLRGPLTEEFQDVIRIAATAEDQGQIINLIYSLPDRVEKILSA